MRERGKRDRQREIETERERKERERAIFTSQHLWKIILHNFTNLDFPFSSIHTRLPETNENKWEKLPLSVVLL